ncbi:MAG: PAS domain S-box protein [Thermaerobacter sp.]|nr:PAS domain S-box protein [Thermaerobacter sp.]
MSEGPAAVPESAGQVAELFRNALDGVVITDAQAVIREVNPAYARICGYSREELIGQPASRLGSGATPIETYRAMWRSLERQGHWMGELLNRKKSGEEWWSFLSITRLTDGKGRTWGYFGVARDTTAQHRSAGRLERELRQLKSVQQVSVTALAKLAEHRDPDIDGHLERIKGYCAQMVAALRGVFPELSDGYAEAVVEGSVLHDVGKVAVPEGILFKPGRLSPEEFSVMKLHTVVGGRVLGEAEGELRGVNSCPICLTNRDNCRSCRPCAGTVSGPILRCASSDRQPAGSRVVPLGACPCTIHTTPTPAPPHCVRTLRPSGFGLPPEVLRLGRSVPGPPKPIRPGGHPPFRRWPSKLRLRFRRVLVQPPP